HQGAYRRAALKLSPPTGFFGPVTESANGQPYKKPLLNAFNLRPRAGKPTVNFRLLQFKGE
ncbi:hypothetical protein, partial [Enterobacter intestinihominis]